MGWRAFFVPRSPFFLLVQYGDFDPKFKKLIFFSKTGSNWGRSLIQERDRPLYFGD
ncbi:MAG: hypothetical protein VKJ64_15215 [Leptolyngbyaceae bacterium]|nr:hypothetical protein [Leptolyngbyaceae bacterium]